MASAVALGSMSCSFDPTAPAQAQMKRWRATKYFTDPLHVRLADAVASGDRAAIAALIKEGADVNAKGKEGIPLLVWAMAKDSVEGFDALLAHGADLTALENDPAFTRNGERTKQVIEVVVSAFNSEFLRKALEHGFDPDYVPNPEMNESLLFRAVWTHAINNAAILLDAGADINHVEANQDTPLILAQAIRYYEMVSFLLARGADAAIKTRGGYDLAALIKRYGDRGVTVHEAPHFWNVVVELKKRGLITDEDIEKANQPK
jgi:ankyrin repeat protein